MKKEFVISFILIMFWVNIYARYDYHVRLKEEVVVGRDDLILERLGNVCQDDEGNFYVLDVNAYKVHKFSPRGKLLLTFGRKGEGPGEFLKPYHIAITEKGELAVSEDLNIVSFFDGQGKYLTRLNLKQKIGGILLSLEYAGPDLFYVEKVVPGNQLKQMLIDLKDDANNKYLFTLPDISVKIIRDGRQALYSVRIHECTPMILFTHYKGYSAAGFSKAYDILLFDRQGKQIAHLKRDIKPLQSTSTEKEAFADAIRSTRLPEDVKKNVIQQIPGTKNIFDKLLISHQYIYVFRTKTDTTADESPIPVDLFSLAGKFQGSMALKDKPTLVTDEWMYIPETDENDNLLLVKYGYEIIPAKEHP
jgi:hypothetical protein